MNQAPAVEGRRLGKYRLVKELASGGMATVYLARPDHFSREYEKSVAIKLVHPHLAKDPSFVRMFLDEARIALQIDHPNVCSVLDVGVEEGAHYLVMEYLPGRSLAEVLRSSLDSKARHQDALPYLVRVIAEAAEGLHAAHVAQTSEGEALEIVHRDVSPHNLMITRAGAVKVVDFGVARARERLEHTEAGQVKGKVEYASPEQIAGGPVDGRTDVWALGVCLFEALTLTKPFRRKDAQETMAAICQAPCPKPTDVAPWIKPDLERIVLRAVDRNPERRFHSARELALALRAYLAREGAIVEGPELSTWLATLPVPAGHATPSPRPGANAESPGQSLTPSGLRRGRLTAWRRRALAALAVAGLATVALAQRPEEPAPAPTPLRAEPGQPHALLSSDRRFDFALPRPELAESPAPTPRALAGPPAPEKGELGRLVFRAQGGVAEVRLDGVARGRTPLDLEATAGPHRIELRDVATGLVAEQAFVLIGGVERRIEVRLDE